MKIFGFRFGKESAAAVATSEYDAIIQALEPWTLACAVGAMNGSMYGSIGARGLCNFDTWLRLVNKSEWKSRTGKSDAKVCGALRTFAENYVGKHMTEVLRQEEQWRGMNPSLVLGPGESATLEIQLREEDSQ